MDRLRTAELENFEGLFRFRAVHVPAGQIPCRPGSISHQYEMTSSLSTALSNEIALHHEMALQSSILTHVPLASAPHSLLLYLLDCDVGYSPIDKVLL